MEVWASGGMGLFRTPMASVWGAEVDPAPAWSRTAWATNLEL